MLALAMALAAPAISAEEPALMVVVSVQRGDTPDADEISAIYKRRKLFWPDGSRIQPVNLPADHPLRQRFSRSLLRLSPEALEEYWNEQYFHGVLPPHVLASEAAVLRFVADTGSAIGYLSACLLDARVRPVLMLAADGRPLPPASAPACNPPVP